MEIDLNETIFNDCRKTEDIIKSQFEGNHFYSNCMERIKRIQSENQFDEINNFEIEEEHIGLIAKILMTNPGLNSPNSINLSGKELVNYLLFYINNHMVMRSLKKPVYFRNGIQVLTLSCFNDYYDYRDELILLSDGKILFDEITNKRYYYFSGIEACYCRIEDIYFDINIPRVKKIHISYNSKYISDKEIFTELENTANDNFWSETHLLIKNEDGIPCFLRLEDYNNYNIDNILMLKKDVILGFIANTIKYLNSLSEETIIEDYIKVLRSRKNDYTIDCIEVEESNILTMKNYILLEIQKYFLYKLCNFYQKIIHKNTEEHQFVISTTLDQENEEIGRRTELITYWFLREFIDEDKWFDYDTFNNSESNSINSDFETEDYLIDQIPMCNTIWNNQFGESFKPYDFLVELENVKYKIEVKSTRGTEENVFYLSIKEMEELLTAPENYLILRLSYINEGQSYYGIQFNEEFYGSFYRAKPETILMIKKNLTKWNEYYKENSIRFKMDQFEPIIETHNKDAKPNLIQYPNVMQLKYWDDFEDFVQGNYFSNFITDQKLKLFNSSLLEPPIDPTQQHNKKDRYPLENKIEPFLIIPEIRVLWTKLLNLKKDEKFNKYSLLKKHFK